MAVKIRLARHGAKKAPYYRVVVADSRAPRDGRLIEEVGRYNPLLDPPMIKLDLEKVDTWIGNGAQPTDTVARLIEVARRQGTEGEAPAEEAAPKKKAAAKEVPVVEEAPVEEPVAEEESADEPAPAEDAPEAEAEEDAE